MSLPLPFLLGLLILLLDEFWASSLPGQVKFVDLLPSLFLLFAPAALAALNGRSLQRSLRMGYLPGPGMRLRFLTQELSVPLFYGLMVMEGGLATYLMDNLPQSQALQLICLISPLLIMEVSMRAIEGRSIRKMERIGVDGFGGMGLSRLPMVFFLVSLLLLLSLSIDLVYMDRNLELFFSVTTLGSTVGMLLLALAMCVCLPLFFKWMMPTSQRLPAALAADIHETASSLGFSPRAVLSMDTGHRVANAAMVGALPWPRFLVLTDGIMSLLDLQALRGVVAHEVGHARAGHPGLILLIVGGLCLLLINPMLIADFESAGLFTQAALAGLIFGAGFFGFRAVAHRFEFEADKMAADALGGAQPCISALSRVAEVHPQHGDRNSFRHPSYSRRIRRLLAWERDAGFRERFDERGRWLRRGIAVFILASLSISIWSQVRNWPIDRAVMLHYRGEFAAAHEQILKIDPEHKGIDMESLQRLDAESLAAIELVGPSANWNEVRDELSARAWARGITELAETGPAAARPWFALALSKESNSPIERSVYRYCAAEADGDTELRDRLRDHLFSLSVPKEIWDAIR